jgi:hypothetical protein
VEPAVDVVGGILGIAVGISVLVWRRQYAAAMVKQRNRVVRYQFGPEDENRIRLMAVVGGCVFVVLGLVVLVMHL